ncbi:MAG: hypothetical protein QF830_01095 [Rhodospirillales bacterium]|jgi:hypothetical protein|nr:hypothetical protein [Rhodospirillales bacterium]MDP6882706.1 hypothetical protein [Rhodospirillales bacterium]
MKKGDPADIAPVTAERLRQETLKQNREDLKRDATGQRRRRGMRRERQDRLILERRQRGLPRRWSRATVWSLAIGTGLLAIVWFFP